MVYVLVGLIIGAILGGIPAMLGLRQGYEVIILFGAILFGGIFGLIGHSKGFAYRLQAQVALCQVQIEYNTRRQP